MDIKLYRYLSFILSLLLILTPDVLFAANYQWIQNDWQGGPATGEYTQHEGAQNGRQDWIKFLSSDPSINPISQGLTISKITDSLSDTAFLGVIKPGDNVEVDPADGALKMTPFTIDSGSGAD